MDTQDTINLDRIMRDQPAVNCHPAYNAAGRLYYIHFYNGEFNSTATLDLQAFTALEEIFLADCAMRDLNAIRFPATLKKLCLNGGTFSRADFTHLAGLKHIQLMDCYADEYVFPASVESLVLSDINTNIPQDMSALTSLEALSLDNNGLDNLQGFRFPPQIAKLDINRNRFTNADLSGLAQLKTLCLQSCAFNDPNDIRLPAGIETLSINFNTNITRCDVSAQTQLKSLSLMSCSQFTALGSSDLPPNIESLFLLFNHAQHTLELVNLAKLNYIFLSEAKGISRLIMQGLPCLQEFVLRDNSKLDTFTLQGFPQLKKAKFNFTLLGSLHLKDLPVLEECELIGNSRLGDFQQINCSQTINIKRS